MARPKSDIDRRILRAARKRFLQQGVDGASLRDIARDARTSVGMVHYWFPTKDALFMAVIEEHYGTLVEGFAVSLAPDAPIEERVRRLYLRLAAMSEDELTVLRIVLREAMIAGPRLKKISKRFLEGHVPLVIATVLEGLSSGALDVQLPPMVAAISLAALGLVPAVMLRRIAPMLPAGMGLPDAARSAELFADVFFRGAGSKPKAR